MLTTPPMIGGVCAYLILQMVVAWYNARYVCMGMRYTQVIASETHAKERRGFTPTPIGAWLSRCASRGIARLRQGRAPKHTEIFSGLSAQQCPDRCGGFTPTPMVPSSLFVRIRDIVLFRVRKGKKDALIPNPDKKTKAPLVWRFTMKSEIPFGPFLVASCVIFWFSYMYALPLPYPL